MNLFIKEYMNLRGINSVTLAEKLGVSKPTISYWITGTSVPAVNKLEAIADALDVEVWQLFKDPTEKDNAECVEGKCPHCGKPIRICLEK